MTTSPYAPAIQMNSFLNSREPMHSQILLPRIVQTRFRLISLKEATGNQVAHMESQQGPTHLRS